MKGQPMFWRIEYAACAAAAFVLIPASLVCAWLARLAMRGQERAETELLMATAKQRVRIARAAGSAR